MGEAVEGIIGVHDVCGIQAHPPHLCNSILHALQPSLFESLAFFRHECVWITAENEAQLLQYLHVAVQE